MKNLIYAVICVILVAAVVASFPLARKRVMDGWAACAPSKEGGGEDLRPWYLAGMAVSVIFMTAVLTFLISLIGPFAGAGWVLTALLANGWEQWKHSRCSSSARVNGRRVKVEVL